MKKHKTYLEIFYTKCRQSNLNITPQRLAIYKAVMRSDNHPSPDMVLNAVKSDFPMMSFSTVYKTLETFEQKGIISKVTTLHDTLRYDHLTKQHHHIICTRCHKVSDLENKDLDMITVPPKITRNNTLISFSVHFNVLCANCKNKK